MNTFHIIFFILQDIVGTYCIYRMIQSFHIGYIKSRKIEIFSYILYHIFGALISTFIAMPIINLISNLIMLFIITFNYSTALMKRILSITITYFLIALLEVIIVAFSGGVFSQILNTDISLFAYYCAYRIIQIIITFIFININKNFALSRNKINLYWIYLVISLVCLAYVFVNNQLYNKIINEVSFTVTAIILVLALIMSLYTYYMNDIKEKNERILQDNANYIRQYELLRNSSDSLSKLQHDLKNHVIYLQSIVGDNEEVKSYLNKMLTNAVIDNSYIDTGNLTIDSILNVKLFDAEQKGIKVEHHITIPIDLNVNEFDMIEILGNLMDDAMDKTLLAGKSKNIKLRIRFDRDRLFVWLFYPYAKSNTEIESFNYIPDSYVNIVKAVEKYSGNIKYDLVEDTREISIMLFIPKREELEAVNK